MVRPVNTALCGVVQRSFDVGSVQSKEAGFVLVRSGSRHVPQFKAMFCDLNGATENPASLKIRQKPAAIRLFPTWEAVPWIMIVLASMSLPLLLQILAQFARHCSQRLTQASQIFFPVGA